MKLSMKIFVETERLILREVVKTDIKGMFELDSNPIVHKYLGPPITTMEQAAANIQHIRKQYAELGNGRWAIIEKSTNEFMGWSGLKLNTDAMNGLQNIHDIGYRLIPRFWGKGYATESAFASLDYAFNTLKLNKVYAAADIDNHASNHILTKIGLERTDEFIFFGRPHYFYEKERK